MLVCVLSAMYIVRMRSNGATAALEAMPAIPPASSLHHSASITNHTSPAEHKQMTASSPWLAALCWTGAVHRGDEKEDMTPLEGLLGRGHAEAQLHALYPVAGVHQRIHYVGGCDLRHHTSVTASSTALHPFPPPQNPFYMHQRLPSHLTGVIVGPDSPLAWSLRDLSVFGRSPACIGEVQQRCQLVEAGLSMQHQGLWQQVHEPPELVQADLAVVVYVQ